MLENYTNKKVSISGYVLALDPDKGYYVLSKGPFYLVFLWYWRSRISYRVKFKIRKDSFFMDQFTTITGVLKVKY